MSAIGPRGGKEESKRWGRLRTDLREAARERLTSGLGRRTGPVSETKYTELFGFFPMEEGNIQLSGSLVKDGQGWSCQYVSEATVETCTRSTDNAQDNSIFHQTISDRLGRLLDDLNVSSRRSARKVDIFTSLTVWTGNDNSIPPAPLRPPLSLASSTI
jgi:hypothetical protein